MVQLHRLAFYQYFRQRTVFPCVTYATRPPYLTPGGGGRGRGRGGGLSGYSVGPEIQRPEIRTPSGAQVTFVRVFPSQKCCAHSLSVCPTPPCEHARIRMITYARRPCRPCQSSVDYGNTKKTQHVGLLVGLGSAARAPTQGRRP